MLRGRDNKKDVRSSGETEVEAPYPVMSPIISDITRARPDSELGRETGGNNQFEWVYSFLFDMQLNHQYLIIESRLLEIFNENGWVQYLWAGVAGVISQEVGVERGGQGCGSQ